MLGTQTVDIEKTGESVIECIQSRREERLDTMSNKLFTREEVEALKASPHTENVSVRSVTFTPEFKRVVYEELTEGKKLQAILESHGIDTAALGSARIGGMQERLFRDAERKEGFENLNRSRKRGTSEKAKEESLIKRVRQLENELAYTRQEVEFLKKIQQADMEARKLWESKHRLK